MKDENQENLNLRVIAEDIRKLIIDLPFIISLLFSTFLETISTYFSAKPKRTLEKELILVTGAATGLGREIVLEIARRFKPILVLWDINEVELLKTVHESEKLGAKVHYYVVDLSRHQDIIETAEKVRKDVGCITVLYNNAGLAHISPFSETNVMLENKVIQVNLMSYIWTIREFLPGMIGRGSGQLVSTCSGIAFMRLRNLTSYAASKYGLRGFLETLKYEMRNHPTNPEIRFSTVYPGWMRTQMSTGINWDARYNSLKIFFKMDPHFVAEKVVDGIVNNTEEIIVPHSLKAIAILYWLLPAKFIDDMERHIFKNMLLVDTNHTASLAGKQHPSEKQNDNSQATRKKIV